MNSKLKIGEALCRINTYHNNIMKHKKRISKNQEKIDLSSSYIHSKYANQLIQAFLSGCASTDMSTNTYHNNSHNSSLKSLHTYQASCLSNVAEICTTLKWNIPNHIDVCVYVF